MTITAIEPRANARKTTNGFWWADLQAHDVKAAVEFYGRTLGWEFREEHDAEGTIVYWTALLGKQTVAGVGEMPGEAVAGGMPSAWTNYVTVDDAAATCATATQLGGRVLMGPMEVMDQGTMAIVLDPTGAAFGLWQNGRHTGADAVNQPSTYTWAELYSSDVDQATAFYAALFGWTAAPMVEGGDYLVLSNDGHQMAGLMPKPAEMGDAPDAWVTYYGVADVMAAKAEVTAAGGTVLWGPTQTGPGTTIGVQDPQGAVVHFIEMEQWDPS
ncbi:MAG: cfp30B [Thermoleophilia bacterium]|nr:cfp30B [Thermoleophilia bacterium]